MAGKGAGWLTPNAVKGFKEDDFPELGKVKQAEGKLSDDEGKEAEGKAQDALGKLADATDDAIDAAKAKAEQLSGKRG